MRNLIVPCCGRNFLNGKPKYLNTYPDGKILALKTLQKLDLEEYNKVYYVILREDIDAFDAVNVLKENIDKELVAFDHEVVILDNRTEGPAETIYLALKKAKIEGEIVVKDLDNMLGIEKGISGNFVAGLNLIDFEKDVYDLRKKSFIVLNEQNIVLDIVEKRLCSNVISAGLYGFEDAKDFIFSYERLQDVNYGIRNLYVSHVISYLIGFLQKNFIYAGITAFESWGSEKEWEEVLHEYNEKNKKGLMLIDLDGTLIDTNRINYAAYRKALNEEGFDIGFEYFSKNCNGYSYKRFLPEIIGENKENVMERIHSKKLELYSSYLSEGNVNRFLVDTIKAAKNSFNVVLVTTASRKNTFEILDYYDLTNLFDAIYTSDEIKNPKPNPEGYLKAMKDFEVDAKDVVVFEDADVGVEAANSIGAQCYKVYYSKEN